ncbi:hypothetical protein OG921_10415 [Aldersonia sp. NBC_00410]|jgi:hypothetical protein|uniref:hypothetical protein n=1 Tax=Aldersonia sp. NBC_00410 TaxID=2975954 RepID=UPI0022557448|nr:hypothetical protein [Aldersonia sp. NBC_00410]MCX5043578.1 hypothetical protein [Aldersonia sp. NBC_00410]
MRTFSDDEMRALLATSHDFSVVILKAGPQYGSAGSDAIVWEHGRRNFALRDAGKLAIVCPVLDDSDVCGIGIFADDVDETTALMADDPGVRAGVFTFEVHPARSFPGDSLPGPLGPTAVPQANL